MNGAFGPVPAAVPWFGALGAVTIGIVRVVEHAVEWDDGQFYWHVSRPLLGAVLSTIAYLIFLAGILATGTTDIAVGKTKNIIDYIIAFVVGFREDVFRNLIKRVSDALLTAGEHETAATQQGRQSEPPAGPAIKLS